MKPLTHGIVSYAGLDKDALLSRAGTLLGLDSTPARYRNVVPLFPVELIQTMEYEGKPSTDNRFVAPSGFSINPAEYHFKLMQDIPALYVGENRSRNFDYEDHYQGTGVFTVDAAWAELFPQYRPFLGDRLVLHLIGGGCQAVAVPASLKLRVNLLDRLESMLGITPQALSFARFAVSAIRSGEPFDADEYAGEYLRSADMQAVDFTQRELELFLQRREMDRTRRVGDEAETFYLRKARQAAQIRQYIPMRYACDLFTAQSMTHTYARLAQPYYTDRDFISDLWIPYGGLRQYLNATGTALHMRALCESYQIAPVYDPKTGGGRYPDGIRIAVVRDRELQLMVADARNNPAYGGGTTLDGKPGKHVWIGNSEDMIRTRRIDLEKLTFRCESLTITPEEFFAQRAKAKAQEVKGRLIDALYRLYMARSGTELNEDTGKTLEERADRLRAAVREGSGAASGYDLDIAYLEQKLVDPAYHDELRETSVECGYAMRATRCRAADPEPDSHPEPERITPETIKPETIKPRQSKGDPTMKLTPKDIAKMLDHSTLQPFLTQEDVRKGCEIALKYDTASVCARPADMPLVKKLLSGSDVKVCTVIGFPHGNHKSEIKLAEAEAALNDGCEELDMVINIGRLLAGDDQYVQDEIADICALAHSRNAKVKVIIETCYLTDEQKVRVCKLAAAAGADWVKTSTGYGSAGCKLEDVVLMRRSVPADCQVKGSGGIRDLDTVLALRAVGATRCGVSATEKIMAEAEVRYLSGTLEEPSLDTVTFEEDGGY
ncbi:MAG TPA: deoxyribose-phosphate aldolase [Candidatus Limiplasma sp.]|nr:deoxyribose-phosphate aldolase [Candidatus Limiplasma sp.]